MADETSTPQAQPAPTPQAAPGMSAQEIQEGKTFAILSYALAIIGLPFFLVPLIMRDNNFSLYHAKQVLMIALFCIAVGLVGGPLTLACGIGLIIVIPGLIFALVLEIMGWRNAAGGKVVPLLLIGKWGEDWFKGVKKA